MAMGLGLGLGLSQKRGGEPPKLDKNSPYYKQVALLVSILPIVATEKQFALKGGTAINLFVRDLPRLSVDIDLTYLPLDDRTTALENIRAAFERLKGRIEESRNDVRVFYQAQNAEHRLIVSTSDVQIKIELSPVLRGCVYEPELKSVSKSVENEFGFAEIQVISFDDLYGGKICAALDRQHPRDLFDVKLLLENEGLSRNLVKAFLVYLISHGRPISELIVPTFKDISESYEKNFVGMTIGSVPITSLEAIRERLVVELHKELTADDKKFLISFKSMSPDWGLLDLKGIEGLPAVRWKMQNLAMMDKEKHKKALELLKNKLNTHTEE